MRRARFVSFLLLIIALVWCGREASAAEFISRFDSMVDVAKDGTLSVSEVVRVHAEGREIRHGIYRDFPLNFKDANGRLHHVNFKLLSVTRDGRPEPYFTEHQDGGVRIYAGDKDAVIPSGNHVYVLRYTTGRQVHWFDGKPELNWNVTGNFWRFPILAARYHLRLIDHARPVHWTAYTGPLGARGTAFRGEVLGNGALTVSTTQMLPAGAGLTVVAELPTSAVTPPGPATQFWYELVDNRHWIFATLGFVLVLVYYAAAWNAVGRDPKGGVVVIPLFHPPAGISPGLANYIHNWGFSREKWRAFTAAALSLAVRNLIRFDQHDETLILKTTGPQPNGAAAALPVGEAAILAWLQEHGGSVEIDKSNGPAVAAGGSNFTSSIEKEDRNRFFRRNLGYVVAGLAMTGLIIAGVVAFGGLRDEDIALLFAMGFAGTLFGVLLVPFLKAIFGAVRHQSIVRRALSSIVLVILVMFFLNFVQIVFTTGLAGALPVVWLLVSGSPFPFALVAGFAALNGLFIYLLRAPTALGRPVMDQLAGFRLYLETAESDRLNLQAPEITADRFEALLPYAVALDVEKPWSDAFAAALRRAHPDEADPMRHYQPAWHSGGNWSSGQFGSAVSGMVSGASSAFASAVPSSSSSGFSGGGGSGGGGGGGGGGGW